MSLFPTPPIPTRPIIQKTPLEKYVAHGITTRPPMNSGLICRYIGAVLARGEVGLTDTEAAALLSTDDSPVNSLEIWRLRLPVLPGPDGENPVHIYETPEMRNGVPVWVHFLAIKNTDKASEISKYHHRNRE